LQPPPASRCCRATTSLPREPARNTPGVTGGTVVTGVEVDGIVVGRIVVDGIAVERVVVLGRPEGRLVEVAPVELTSSLDSPARRITATISAPTTRPATTT